MSSTAGPWRELARRALQAAIRAGSASVRGAPANRPVGPRPNSTGPQVRDTPPTGRHLDYAPDLDGRADPGEIVWTWVAFEEDAGQGKDRPVLVVGREGDLLLGLMLSSQDYHRADPQWLGLGSGAWDGENRPSWVRLDRVIEVREDGIRREGAVLDGSRFGNVAAALRRDHGWR